MSQAFVPQATLVSARLSRNEIGGCRGTSSFKSVSHYHGIRVDYWPSGLAGRFAIALLFVGRKVTRRKVARAQGCASTAARNEVKTRWFMLLAVTLCSMTNAFLCMTFSVIESMSAQALSISTLEVAGLYTIWLFTTFIGLTPGTWMTEKSPGFAIVWSAVLNMASAVVRFFGGQGSYEVIIASQILCGAAAWPIFTLPSAVSHRLFPVQKQALATSIMLQANYAGWLLGVIFPSLLSSTASFGRICAQQAAISLFASLFAFIAFTLARHTQTLVKQYTKDCNQKAAKSGFIELVRAMSTHPKLAVQMLAHGTLGGVSFAAPSAIYFILDNFGFSSSAAMAVNVAFIASGLIAGICLGRSCKNTKDFGKALHACYSLCLASLAMCAFLAAKGMLIGTGWNFWLLFLLSIVSGGSSLGFIGIAIESTSLYPVRSSFVSWGIEMGVLGNAALLSFYAARPYGFLMLAIATATATLAHLSSYEGRKL